MGRTFTQLNEAKAVLKLIHGFSTWVVMLTLYNYVSMMIKNFDDPTVNIDENTTCFYFNHFTPRLNSDYCQRKIHGRNVNAKLNMSNLRPFQTSP